MTARSLAYPTVVLILELTATALPAGAPEPGACCLPGSCTILAEDACLELGGAYQGDGVSCTVPTGETSTYFDKPGLAIPNGSPAGVSDQIVVGDDFDIVDLDVFVEIFHGSIGDLTVDLVSPSGKITNLWDHGCSGTANMSFTFDDEGIDTSCFIVSVPGNGSGPPAVLGNGPPMSQFGGDSSAGTWEIRVTDDVPGENSGTLAFWSLEFDEGASPCTTTVVSRQEPPGCNSATDPACCRRAAAPSGEFGDPVYLFSGEFYLAEEDLRIRGRGPDFVWTRKYRSQIGPNVGIGAGWDHSYNLTLASIAIGPGEAQALIFQDPDTMSWSPPADPGGDPADLRYCTQRAGSSTEFPAGTFIEVDGVDVSSDDTDEPSNGEAFYYLVSAKNGGGEGPLGSASSGVPRIGLQCGTSGLALRLGDGNTRRDVYMPQPDGTWVASEFFRVITQNPDAGYTLTHQDTSTWSFLPFDGTPQEGKISSLVDRNGNVLTFEYDGQGRLSKITDTLNREIDVGYDANGFIGSITDYTGRQVLYEYYDGVEFGGSFGDLKSVTTPAVIGTPLGNDFPAGKTTTYTYSIGFGDNRLNHNLLTITDPKGQTYLTNTYSAETDPSKPNFDRVVRQVWGELADIIDYVYVQQVPSAANGFAVTKAIVNDRVGNVEEHFFDARNREVRRLDYTGRAPHPDQPTTEGANRPTGQLRGTDPASFETRWEFDDDSLLTRTIHPNGNEDVLVYDPGNADRRAQGNLLQQCRLPGPLGGDQAQICETFEYDDGFGGCCGTNFVTRHVDGRGNETLHSYDAAGNRVQTIHRIPSIVEDFEYNSFGQRTAHVLPDNGSSHRRRDEYLYYGPAGEAQEGYLRQEIVDANGFALTTTYHYDDVGNVTRVVDPRGNDTILVYNQLDQLIRTDSREVEVSPGVLVRYRRDMFYDANDNLVRLDVRNVDENGDLQANTDFTTVYEYEILNSLIRECRESGAYTGVIPGSTNQPVCTGLPVSEFITTEYGYDANRNRTLTRLGEATNGNQPANRVSTLYDERDLPFRVIRAEGDSDQSTAQSDYDGNGNLERTHQGLEGTPRVTQYAHDGYDRLTSSTDPMGNVTEYHYDPNGNIGGEPDPVGNPGVPNPFGRRVSGELTDAPGSTGNVRLSEVTYVYDAMDRRTREEVAFFDTATQNPLPGGQQTGKVLTVTEYSDNSQVTRVVNDNLHDVVTVYDTANRVSTTTDAKGNTVTYAYDANSNVTSTVEVEKSDLGNPDQSFTTTSTYDAVDRVVSTTDNVGNTTEFGYDSRDNRTSLTDALGNVTRTTYDGIGRLLATTRELTDTGEGGGVVVGTIVTSRAWDDTSRLVGQTDDNGNTTTYAHDALDRQVSVTHADGTVRSHTYDVHGNVLTTIDANGSVVTATYDLRDRVTNKTIVPGAGVSNDTTAESYAYDGLSRLVEASDDDSTVLRSYDSLSHVTTETLNGKVTQSVHDGVGNETQCTYPSGRVITTTYDELERQKTISDQAGSIATYDYVGPGRVERRDYGNGTRTEYEYDGITGVPNPAGDFGVRRTIRTKHTRISDGTILDDRTYLWDRLGNKLRRTDVRAGGPELTHDYGYDSEYRLTQSTVTDPSTVFRDHGYLLDGVGNREEVTGGTEPQVYTMDDTTPEPADFQMNQYSATPPFSTPRAYDANGNLLNGPVLNYSYDYRNQMVEHFVFFGKDVILATFDYDALGRRIVVVEDANGVGTGPTETRYFYDGWRVCEERDGADVVRATYAYGRYIDEVLTMARGGTDYYYHADDLHNVMAISDGTGTVAERYEYGDYGGPANPSTAQPTGSLSAIGNPYGFNGRRFDPVSGLYYYRTRYLEPFTGRFTTRDTIGAWGDTGNLGNGFAYVGNSPWTASDPFGMWEEVCTDVAGGGCFVGIICNDGTILTCWTSSWEQVDCDPEDSARWDLACANHGGYAYVPDQDPDRLRPKRMVDYFGSGHFELAVPLGMTGQRKGDRRMLEAAPRASIGDVGTPTLIYQSEKTGSWIAYCNDHPIHPTYVGSFPTRSAAVKEARRVCGKGNFGLCGTGMESMISSPSEQAAPF